MAHLRLSDLPEVPAGSAITIEETVDGLRLHWLNPRGGLGRYAVGSFLLVWLGFRVFVVIVFMSELARRAASNDPYVLGWLSGWVCVTGLILFILLRLFARAKPEFLVLGDTELRHGAGTPPFSAYSTRAWKQLFRRPKVTVADKSVSAKPVLGGGGKHQRLTVDVGADRIEIGEFLREPERDWLAQVLQLYFGESGNGQA